MNGNPRIRKEGLGRSEMELENVLGPAKAVLM